MNEQELTPEQHAEFVALEMELSQQFSRTNVDLSQVLDRLRQVHPPVERHISENESELTLTIDLSAIIETLKHLPDGAGNDAFVTTYNARPS